MARKKRLNVEQIFRKAVGNSKKLQGLAYGAAKKKAERLKREAIEELNAHPVTQELERGPSGMGSSLLGGRGNFFGFLGFDSGYDPVTIVRDAFEKNIGIKNKKGVLKQQTKKSLLWEFDINYPSVADIYNVTQNELEWTTRSWVKGVEKGITNAVHTIFKDTERSRSGVALQSERKIGFINFSRTPYITPIIQKLTKELK